ncbi:hypothetical protein DPMN_104673 [Dreissena polymorpha]|uniref:Uncharacterized protein n=1 Tax=Dreissena polymorpha TaxID=45954 RepID=A0A9D4H876_DREPO|nr:hypothetical protein DPMN_104673 [Dreissena polymorpha]
MFIYVGIFSSNIYYDTSSVAIILFIVFVVTSLMLTLVYLYTFCILHKYGYCFMSSLRQDVEVVAGTLERVLRDRAERNP